MATLRLFTRVLDGTDETARRYNLSLIEEYLSSQARSPCCCGLEAFGCAGVRP